MEPARNLADPAFEPTDEDLVGLSARAFADVRAAHQRVLEKLRAEIEEERRRVLSALDARRDAKDG